jgi:hypothetical protein
MTPQLGASLTIVILTNLEVSFMLLELSNMLQENIYSTGVTHDDPYLQLTYIYITVHLFKVLKIWTCVVKHLANDELGHSVVGETRLFIYCSISLLISS